MIGATTELRVRDALSRSAFSAVYQPLVEVATGEVVSFEALLRWYDEDVPVMPTQDLVDVLEKTGLIVEVGPMMIREVARQQYEWAARGVRGRRVFVNVSARELEPALIRTICGLVSRSDVLLGIEITEASLMDDIDRACEMLAELRRHGVLVAVDDFGTGYSSLSRLKKLPVDVLKIDRSFVQTVHEDPVDVAIVRSIVDLGHALGLTVVAEGIESHAQWRVLERLGVDRIQGYYVGRPASAHETCDLLAA